MSDEVKLLPCPLCGRQPALNRLHHSTMQIHCTQTHPGQHCVVVTERSHEAAIAAWNTRAIEATDEVVERVVMALRQVNTAKNGYGATVPNYPELARAAIAAIEATRPTGQSLGVPFGSGHSRAEPEEVSVVPTSVPNAAKSLGELGMPVRRMSKDEMRKEFGNGTD